VHILLDECLPRRLKRELIGHDAKSVPEMGWAGKTNGALLSVAQVEFDVFLTVDRNLSFQQDVNKFNIAVVVLVAKSNKLAALQPLVPEVLSLLAALVPGQVVRVGA
jgi:hypothetical protein